MQKLLLGVEVTALQLGVRGKGGRVTEAKNKAGETNKREQTNLLFPMIGLCWQMLEHLSSLHPLASHTFLPIFISVITTSAFLQPEEFQSLASIQSSDNQNVQ